jgi:hypothetical protein
MVKLAMGTLCGRGNASGEKKVIFPKVSAHSCRAQGRTKLETVEPGEEEALQILSALSFSRADRSIPRCRRAPYSGSQETCLFVEVASIASAGINASPKPANASSAR